MSRTVLWCVVVVLFLTAPFWLAATAALVVWWYGTVRRPHTTDPVSAHSLLNAGGIGPSAQLLHLALLRDALRAAQRRGALVPDEYRRLLEVVDTLETRACADLMVSGADRREALDSAWRALQIAAGEPSMTPPWRRAASAAETLPAAVTAGPDTIERRTPRLDRRAQVEIPVVASGDVAKPANCPQQPVVRERASAAPQPERARRPQASPRPAHGRPGRLAQLRRRGLAFLARVVWPLLWQNIGWFIGGFCFVSGSVFLVAYTSGFVKALVVVGTLGLYGLLLLWGGLRVRRQRPQLAVAAQVLTALGMLLIPLEFAAATRLLEAGLGDPWRLALSVTIALVVLALSVPATRLGSGMMDRCLLSGHASLFVLLSAVQFAAPLLTVIPWWPLLALLHLTLFGLFCVAVDRFVRCWLPRLFVDRRPLAYYAAGTLFYAALVSFVHLSWTAGITLPAGYAGPFLMALCGLLLHIDLQFKQRVDKTVRIGHLNFVIYALSAVAMLATLLPSANVDVVFWPLLLTLSIACVLYATMVWRYLSVAPLYLLLAAFAALYAVLILRLCPQALHLIASLPGFYGLLRMRALVLRRGSVALANVIERVVLLFVGALTAWVLLGAVPGWLAMLTPLTALLTVMVVAGLLFSRPAERAVGSVVVAGPRGYLLSGLAMLTVAYAPLAMPWAEQFSIGLLALAAAWVWWTATGLVATRPRIEPELAANSALLSIAVATACAALLSAAMPFLIWVLAGVGVLLLGLGLVLCSRAPLYAALVAWAGASWRLVDHYHIGTSGLTALLAAAVLFLLQRWLRKTQPVAEDGKPAAPVCSRSMRLLWCWPLRRDAYSNRIDMVMQPLEVALSGLWLLGWYKVAAAVAAGVSLTAVGGVVLAPADGWVAAAIMALLLTVLRSGGSARGVWLLPPCLLLAVCLVLVATPAGWQPPAIALAAVLCWQLASAAPALSSRWLERLGWNDGFGVPDIRRLAERVVHWSAFVLVLGAVLLALAGGGRQPLLATLVIAVGFLWRAGDRYRLQFHAYLVVAGAASLVLLSVRWWIVPMLPVAPTVLQVALVQALIAVGLSEWCCRLSMIPASGGIRRYALPLYHLAYLLYGLALVATLVSVAHEPSAVERAWSVVLLCVLAVALLPLLRPPAMALPAVLSGTGAPVRGVLIPLLATLAVALVCRIDGPGFLVWSALLWIAGDRLLPRWNRWVARSQTPYPLRMPVAGSFSLVLGLVLVVVGGLIDTLGLMAQPGAGVEPPTLLQRLSLAHLLALQIYLLLLLRGHERSGLLRWSAAVLLVPIVPLLLLRAVPVDAGIGPVVVVGMLLWLNLLLRWGLIWRWTVPLRWRRRLPLQRLGGPLRRLSAGLLSIALAAAAVPVIGRFVGALAGDPRVALPPLLDMALHALLAASFVHLLRLEPKRIWAHLLLLALLVTVIAPLTALVGPVAAVSLWTTLLLSAVLALEPRRSVRALRVQRVADRWFDAWFGCSLLVWILIDVASVGGRVLASALLLAMALIIGLRASAAGEHKRARRWLQGATLLALVWMHWLGWLWLPAGIPDARLLPWYALVVAGLSWLTGRIAAQSLSVRPWPVARVLAPAVAAALVWWPAWSAPRLFGLALLEWLLAVGGLCLDPASGPAGSPMFAAGDWATIVAGGVLVALWSKQHWLSLNVRIVGMALTTALLLVGARLVLFGTVPLSVWDTSLVLALGFVLAALEQCWRRHGHVPVSLRVLTLSMPGLALLTVPLQLGSVRAFVSLTASGLLYLTLRSGRRNDPAGLLALLAFTVGAYLWIPALAGRSGLLQLYTVPAAVGVLLMVQLHLLELRPAVANGVRLVALSTLYASASLDLFLRPDLATFVLALGLSLVGILLGIVLKLRAFLYAGTVFLTLNVVGQLVAHAPEETLGKAILLMGLGGLITGGMIWFSVQREIILERLRIVRADLADWS